MNIRNVQHLLHLLLSNSNIWKEVIQLWFALCFVTLKLNAVRMTWKWVRCVALWFFWGCGLTQEMFLRDVLPCWQGWEMLRCTIQFKTFQWISSCLLLPSTLIFWKLLWWLLACFSFYWMIAVSPSWRRTLGKNAVLLGHQGPTVTWNVWKSSLLKGCLLLRHCQWCHYGLLVM